MKQAIKEITVTELKGMRDRNEAFTLIDVREPAEREICEIGGQCLPLNEIGSAVAEIPREGLVIVYCRSGGRSGRAVAELQERHGFSNLVNLRGGILAWIDEIDPSLTKY